MGMDPLFGSEAFEVTIILDQAECFVRRGLFLARRQQERRRRHIAAKADIDQVVLGFGGHDQQGVNARRHTALGHAPAHARGFFPDREAQRAQNTGEQKVLLEAIAAAAALHELALERARVE